MIRVLGAIIAAYITLVRRTNQLDVVDLNAAHKIRFSLPCIVVTWHGQQMLTHMALPEGQPVAVLASRHRDGALVKSASQWLGLDTVLGSGSHDPAKIRRKGGVGAFLGLLRCLRNGRSVVLTADVPKVARVAGPGVIALAKASGRPIYAVATHFSRRIELNNWNRTIIPIPFGHCVLVVSQPLYVPGRATPEISELCRRRLEITLNDVHDTKHRDLTTLGY